SLHMEVTAFLHANLITLDPTVPGAWGILHDQALLVSQGRIVGIQPTESLVFEQNYKVVDLQHRWVTPGFIDCHTHLVYAGCRAGEWEQRLTGVSYTSIAQAGGGILYTVSQTRQASEKELFDLAIPRLHALMAEGVTTIEIKSGYGLTVIDELKTLRVARRLAETFPVEISATLLAAHAVPPEYRDRPDDYVSIIVQELIPQVAEEHLAEAVDVFCEKIAFSVSQCDRIWCAARKYGLAVKGHVEQLSFLGGAEKLAQHLPWSADHLEYLSEGGVLALKQSGAVATLLPGAFYFLREQQKPPVDLLRRHQVPIAVATDFNPGTSPFASIRLAMNQAVVLFGLTPAEALQGVTIHASKALGREKNHGILRTGYLADFLIWDISHPAELMCSLGLIAPIQRYFRGNLKNVP
ncbi:MAG TPA: imidazolonepropionase, partial [Gemmatales bacterium]|nr:imidazolonepropionase [Gemmatales bacterium]